MNKKSELLKNTLIILLGKVCTQFLSYFLLPLYTSCLDSEQFGIVDLITTYVTLFVPIITLQLEMGIFRELIDSRENTTKQREIITSGVVSIVIQSIVCLFIYFILNLFIKVPFGSYVLFCVISTLFSNLLLQIARGFGDNMGYSIASAIAGISTIIFNIIFLLGLKFKIEGMLLSSALGNLLAIIFLFFRLKIYKYINLKVYSKIMNKKLLKYSMPLVPNGLIWWIINVSDRTLITFFIGVSANGIYAVANKFSNILIQIYNVFNLSWTESASLHINASDRDEFFSSTFDDVLKLFGSICILIVTFLPFIFNLLINAEFIDSYNYIPILLVGTLTNIVVAFIGSIYIAKKMTRQVALTSFWAGLLNIIINIILIKKIGLFAAALSTTLAFLIMSIYRIMDVQKYVKLKFNFTNLIFIITLLIISCYFYYLRNFNFCFIWAIICSIIIGIFNYKNILSIINKLIFRKKQT